jgi:2-methylcitrate dehydratase PrpD
VNGRVDLATFQPPQITDPRVAALASRVRVVNDDKIDPSAMSPTRMQIALSDGSRLERYLEVMQGSPEEPMTDAQALEKFSACMASGLGASGTAIDRLARTVMAMDGLDDVSDLIAQFPQDGWSSSGR